MTDFHPESTWSDPTPPPPSEDFWESSRPAPIQEHNASRPSARAQRRPAAALAADVSELLESMGRKRVPRLEAVRARVQRARAAMALDALETALHSLHAGTSAMDFLAGRSGGERATEFLRQGEALVEASRRMALQGVEWLERQASEAPVARLVWIDLMLESGSLRKRVRQAAHWLAEMDQDLVSRRKGPNTEVTLRAIEELARRGVGMHERLQNVHRLCAQARTVHLQCEQLAAEREALCRTVHGLVLPACGQLEDALQPLLQAAAYRGLVPTELVGAIDAHHSLQVVLTQAGAQIVRLNAGEQELAAQLALMQERALRAA